MRLLQFHCGAPPLPCEVRFKVGTHRSGIGAATDNHNVNPIRRWIGVSFGSRWFFGLMLHDPQRSTWTEQDGGRKTIANLRELLAAAEQALLNQTARQPAARPEVRCEGCGSSWTDEDLARERTANPTLLSCCPERKPLTIDRWRERVAAEREACAEAVQHGLHGVSLVGVDKVYAEGMIDGLTLAADTIRARST